MGFYVSNLPKTVAFWDDFLGYAEPYVLKRKDGSTRMAFIKINDRQHIELFAEEPPAGHSRLSHIAFLTDNAEQMRAYLQSRGIAVKPSVGAGRTGDLNFEVKDPDGHLVEFVQSQPAGQEVQNAGKYLPATRISKQVLHVGFLIASSRKSMDFYGTILGFREFWRGSASGKTLSWIDMRVPNGHDYLELMLYRTLPPPDKRGVSNHISLMVPDVRKSVAILKSRPAFQTYGHTIEVKIGVNGQRQANLFDPDGTRIELMEPFTANGKPVPPSTAPPPQ